MNLRAVQATLARLREVAGPEGVQIHPEFGWFGFLDLPLPSLNAPVEVHLNQTLAHSTHEWRPHKPRAHRRTRHYPKSKQRDFLKFQGLVSQLAKRHGPSTVKQWLSQELRRA